jgi:spore coat protein U domain-containing protein, fimbrial subunit CupE1/2/3/6
MDAGMIPPVSFAMRCAIFFVAACLLAPIPNAKAAVTFTCTVSATGIAFGNYNPLSPIGDSAAGTWSVSCNAIGSGSATVSGTLTLSTGSSGSYVARTMRSGTHALQYNIYLTPSYTQVMGDGSAGTYAPSESGTVTAGQVYQITGYLYGYMPPSQDVPAGSYADSIVVTVTY